MNLVIQEEETGCGIASVANIVNLGMLREKPTQSASLQMIKAYILIPAMSGSYSVNML